MAAGGRNVSVRVIAVVIVCVSLVAAAVVLGVKGASASSAADRRNAAAARADAEAQQLRTQLPALETRQNAINRVYTRLLSDVRLFGPSFRGAVYQGYNLFGTSVPDIVTEFNKLATSGAGAPAAIAADSRLVHLLTDASGWVDLISSDADQFATDRAEIRTALAQGAKP